MSHEIDRVSKTSISLCFIAVFYVKNDRLDATDFFSECFTLTSRNITWFYYSNFVFILKISFIAKYKCVLQLCVFQAL